MQLLRPMGYNGIVYRPGQEADLEAAIAKVTAQAEKDKKDAVTPNFAALAEAGVVRMDEPPAPDAPAESKTAGKKKGKATPAPES